MKDFSKSIFLSYYLTSYEEVGKIDLSFRRVYLLNKKYFQIKQDELIYFIALT